MGTQLWTYCLIIYFIMLSIIVTIMSAGGLLTDDIIISTSAIRVNPYDINGSSLTPNTDDYSWGFGDWAKDMFSFFIFNISMFGGNSILMTYFWIIRIITVYIPALFLFLSILYSLPFSGGH